LSVVAYNGETQRLEIFDHAGPFGSFSSWSKSEIDAVGNLVQDTAVAVDLGTGLATGPATALTATAYYDDVNKLLKVATRAGVGQSWQVQDAIVLPNVGPDNGIAIRPADQAIGVSCYDAANEGLRFALRAPQGTWQKSELVDVTDHPGFGGSLAFDDQDVPYITYYQQNYGDLMLAWRKKAP
jgi:hypothetical protein